ncbi:MAG TPA: hypothetical protein VH370_21765 [Humisphaera sp.]|jgi:predicted ABC-type ATPase|nr:hypothetical protein [Humisphaera sp.]
MQNFAFETTLASRTFAPRIRDLRSNGYSFHLIYLWLPSADQAIARVASRVQMGGHFVPDETVRRRYIAGIQNFFSLYRPIADSWRWYDNSNREKPTLIASGKAEKYERVLDWKTWKAIAQIKSQIPGYRG